MGNPFEMPRGPSNPYAPSEEYRFDPSAFSTGEPGQQLGSLLMQRAEGTAPSAAELQMKAGLGRQLAGTQSMARGATGMSPGMAMRLAGRRGDALSAQTNQQMGVLRAQEQAQAQSQLGQWLNSQMQAQMALEQGRGQQRMGYNQAITSVTDPGSAGGWGWPLLGAASQAGAAYLTGGASAAGGLGGSVIPGASWGGKGFGRFGSYDTPTTDAGRWAGDWGGGGGGWGEGPGGMPW